MSTSKVPALEHLRLTALRGKSDTAAKLAELTQTVSDAITELDEQKQDLALIRTVALAASAWDATTLTQTVAVDGVAADGNTQAIFVRCSDSSVTATGVAENSMTFTADALPSSDVTAEVSIFDATTA